MLIGAGLPKIYKMLSEAKSYSERLFWYKEIDSLTVDQARQAIQAVSYTHLDVYKRQGHCTLKSTS